MRMGREGVRVRMGREGVRESRERKRVWRVRMVRGNGKREWV